MIKRCSTDSFASVSKKQGHGFGVFFLLAFIFLTVSKTVGRSRVFPLLH